jgi:hypothetical protein
MKELARSVLVGGALWFLAYGTWQWGPRTSWRRALVALLLPVLIVKAKLTYGKRWRVPLSQSLSFCVPACTLFLFLEIFTSSHSESLDPAAKLASVLETLAEFLYQNAITTGSGLLTLLCAFGVDLRGAESRAFRAALAVIAMATLLIGVPCAAILWLLLSEF